MEWSVDDLVGLIPAAGKGTRLNLPFPKELYPIIQNNKFRPVAQSILEQITSAGVGHIVFVVNENKHQLLQYFGNGQRFLCNISYVVQEPPKVNALHAISPGLAEALDSGYHLVKDKLVFFGMPDTIIFPDYVFKEAFNQLRDDQDGILCLFRTNKPEKSGMVRTDGYKVIEVIDKPLQTDLEWMWGCIIWKPIFSEFLHTSIHHRKIFEFSTILNDAIKTGLNLASIKFHDGKYLDLGTYEDVVRVEALKESID